MQQGRGIKHRPRKPTAMIAGSPADKRSREREPTPELREPNCPEDLSDEARGEWSRICQLLLKIGVLSEIDGDALAQYCRGLVLWRAMCIQVEKDGVTIDTEEGPKAHPLIDKIRGQATLLVRYLCEFGMTPSSRSAVKTGSNFDPENELEKFAKLKIAE